MSDTVSDLASRAQAREEVAQFFCVHWWDDETSTCDCGSPFVHSDHLAEVLTRPEVFARLAGLLGYVKADGEEIQVQCGGLTYPQVFGTVEEARQWSFGLRPRSAARAKVVRRLVGPWEKVTDAEQG